MQAYTKTPWGQRWLLKCGQAARAMLRMDSEFIPGADRGLCRVVFERVNEIVEIVVDVSELHDKGQVFLLNEAAGTAFAELRMDTRTLRDNEIPGWKTVPFGTIFASSSAGVWFSLDASHEDETARWQLACGREVANNLNWSGFALSTDQSRFSYRVHFCVT